MRVAVNSIGDDEFAGVADGDRKHQQRERTAESAAQIWTGRETYSNAELQRAR